MSVLRDRGRDPRLSTSLTMLSSLWSLASKNSLDGDFFMTHYSCPAPAPTWAGPARRIGRQSKKTRRPCRACAIKHFHRRSKLSIKFGRPRVHGPAGRAAAGALPEAFAAQRFHTGSLPPAPCNPGTLGVQKQQRTAAYRNQLHSRPTMRPAGKPELPMPRWSRWMQSL